MPIIANCSTAHARQWKPSISSVACSCKCTAGYAYCCLSSSKCTVAVTTCTVFCPHPCLQWRHYQNCQNCWDGPAYEDVTAGSSCASCLPPHAHIVTMQHQTKPAACLVASSLPSTACVPFAGCSASAASQLYQPQRTSCLPRWGNPLTAALTDTNRAYQLTMPN